MDKSDKTTFSNSPAVKALHKYLADPEKMKPEQQQWWMQVGEGPVVPVRQVVICNPERGTGIAIGLRPEPIFEFQGPILVQPRGGGEVCMLFFLHPKTNEVWIGAVQEDRKNMGGKQLCAIGGMNEIKLTRDEVRRQELTQEAVLEGESFKPFTIKGIPVNGDRLFFLADAKKGEGVRFSALEIPIDTVEPVGGPNGQRAKFREGVTSLGAESDVVFLPWYVMGCQSPDALLQAGITRLMSYLHEQEHAQH